MINVSQTVNKNENIDSNATTSDSNVKIRQVFDDATNFIAGSFRLNLGFRKVFIFVFRPQTITVECHLF